MFHEQKRKAQVPMKKGGPSWKQRHPKLAPALRTSAKLTYATAASHYAGIRNKGAPAPLYGKILRQGVAQAAPYAAHAAYKKVKTRKGGNKRGKR